VIVTPGYHKRPDLTAQMFDEEGFYRIGDAGRFVDADDPSQGLVFDGRVVEDFKLSSGTFVLVGTLRTTAVAAGLAGAAGRGCLRPRS
jgi:feruloyl-CoA synthase